MSTVTEATGTASRLAFRRWLTGNQLAALPPAMAPLAFSLATVTMAGGSRVGAAMVMAMTGCQVVFAVPLGRLGDRIGAGRFLRWILVLRAVVIAVLAVAIVLRTGPVVVIVIAAFGGLANGAISGALRSQLSDLVPTSRMARAVALAATANELVFVAGPVLAAVLAAAVPVLGVAVMAAASLFSAALVPLAGAPRPRSKAHDRTPIERIFLLWMAFAVAASLAVALVEVGAVTLTLRLGLAPAYAVVFTVALCVSSVTGGALITWHGRPIRPWLVLAMIGATFAGVVAVGLAPAVWVAVVGAVLIGLCLAPLATYYSLRAEEALPVHRRAEGFSWLRTMTGLGVAIASLLISVLPFAVAGVVVAVAVTTVFVTFIPFVRRRSLEPGSSIRPAP
ncbi:MFS transporter [Fodinicola acaciae]|uniref:MFS transporter n=1 Tax=Fodinicola acaciae TaxID=2681555 RepID=UPI0013D80095|nr:MFS transporter [Fodinicola acaciae]